jgi:hypothetical protein
MFLAGFAAISMVSADKTLVCLVFTGSASQNG